MVLALWTWAIAGWMGVTRVWGMHKAGVSLYRAIAERQIELESKLPAAVNWKAHNYMHLTEYPTIVYPTVIILALLGGDSEFNVKVMWVYVGMRMVHSLVQTLWNRVIVRFCIFLGSACVHLILMIQAMRILMA